MLVCIVTLVLLGRVGSTSATTGPDDGASAAYSSAFTFSFDDARLLPVRTAIGYVLAWAGTSLLAGALGAHLAARRSAPSAARPARPSQVLAGAAALLVVAGTALVLVQPSSDEIGSFAYAPLSDSVSTPGTVLLRPDAPIVWVAGWVGTVLLCLFVGRMVASRARH